MPNGLRLVPCDLHGIPALKQNTEHRPTRKRLGMWAQRKLGRDRLGKRQHHQKHRHHSRIHYQRNESIPEARDFVEAVI